MRSGADLTSPLLKGEPDLPNWCVVQQVAPSETRDGVERVKIRDRSAKPCNPATMASQY